MTIFFIRKEEYKCIHLNKCCQLLYRSPQRDTKIRFHSLENPPCPSPMDSCNGNIVLAHSHWCPSNLLFEILMHSAYGCPWRNWNWSPKEIAWAVMGTSWYTHIVSLIYKLHLASSSRYWLSSLKQFVAQVLIIYGVTFLQLPLPEHRMGHALNPND